MTRRTSPRPATARRRPARWRRTLVVVLVLLLTAAVGVVLLPAAAKAATAPGTYAYVANSGSDSVSVIDTASNTVTATVALPGGATPEAIAVSGDGTRVYVANHGNDTVSVIDTASNTVTATIPLAQNPDSIVVAPDGAHVYVAYDGTGQGTYPLTVIGTASNTITNTGSVNFCPCDLAMSPNGAHLYVVAMGNSSVSVFDDTAGGPSASTLLSIPNADAIAVSHDGTRAYIGGGSAKVPVVDTAAVAESTPPITLTGTVFSVQSVAVSPDDTTAYAVTFDINHPTAGTVQAADTSSRAVTATIPVTNANRLAVTPDGSHVYATTTDGTVRVIDTATRTLGPAAIAVGSSPAGLAIGRITAPVTLNNPPLPSATMDSSYSQFLTASGGTSPYTWSVVSGSLPAGLSLDPALGDITGAPTTYGDFPFTVQASDSSIARQSATQALTLTVNPAPLAATTPPPPAGTVGIPYNTQLTASGGVPPYTWSVTSGSLPPGLHLDASVGVISGTPTATGSNTFTVQASDAAAAPFHQSASQQLTIPIVSVSNHGMVVAWGDDSTGESTVPSGLSNVTAIAAGRSASFALENDGTIIGWGDNSTGELTVPTTAQGATSAIAAGGSHVLALENDGTVLAWGDNGSGQLNVPAGLSGVTAVAAGSGFSLALKRDGTVVAWGDNGSGQLNVPAAAQGRVTAIAAGNGFGLALLSNRSVVGWGDDGSGQLNAPDATRGSTVAIAAGGSHSLALKKDGTVVGWGDNGAGESTPPSGLSGVTAISAGGSHSLALKSDGTVVAWGDNGAGELTVPPGLSGVTAIAGGNDFSLALVQAFTVTSTTGSLPAALTGTAYSSTTLNTANGSAPYTWTLSPATPLPPGLSLSTTGTLTGTPTGAGTFDFTVRVTDSASRVTTRALSITAVDQLTVQFSSPLPAAVAGTAYQAQVSATPTGGVAPYSWSATAPLPAGLALDPATGTLSGTPTAAGSFTVAVRVQDSSLPDQLIVPQQQNLVLVVAPAPSATRLAATPNPSAAGQPVALTATVSSTGPTPGGTVTFTDGGATLGTAQLSTVAGVVSATLSTSTLAPGTHALTATYGGDATHRASTSPALTQTVQANAKLSASPAIAPPNTVVTVTASGLPAGQPVTLRLQGLGSTQSAVVQGNGTLSAHLVINPGLDAGPHALDVLGASSPTPLVTVPITVVPGTLLPPDFSTRH